MKRKYLVLISLIFISQAANADQVQTGVTETTSYVQQIGLSICGLGGSVGAIMLGINSDSGSAWISKALIAASALGAIPFLVKEIGSFFGIG